MPPTTRPLRQALSLAMIAVMASFGLGSGCGPPSTPQEEATPIPPLTCDSDPGRQGFRDPRTQDCVTAPTTDQQAAFFAYDQLYAYASADSDLLTTGTIQLIHPLTVSDVTAVIDALTPRGAVTLSLRFPTFREGTFLPLQLRADEALAPPTLLAALRDTIAFRPYSPTEVTELERALVEDPIVVAVVVEGRLGQLRSLWHEHPDLVQLITFDLPPAP